MRGPVVMGRVLDDSRGKLASIRRGHPGRGRGAPPIIILFYRKAYRSGRAFAFVSLRRVLRFGRTSPSPSVFVFTSKFSSSKFRYRLSLL